MQLTDLRSLLFVPATSDAMLQKAAERGADAIVLDLEDAVPAHRKAKARASAARAVAALAGRVPLLVRVNASPGMLRADLAALPLDQLQAVMLPKVEDTAQVDAALAAMAAGCAAPPPIAALVETPRGVLRAQDIAAHPALGALGFGAEDFAAEMMVEPQPASLGWAAQKVATSARAWGLACWGLPGSVSDILEFEAFARLVEAARGFGFSGTVCIHPRQVPAANAGFAPTASQLAWARKVVEADRRAQAKGLGVVALEGRMIDRPVVERARRWLQQGAR